MQLKDQITEWLRLQVAEARVDGIVVGLSGGIDSAVVSGLSAMAIGPEHVLGVALPCHSIPEDIADARLAADTWGIEYLSFDLSSQFDAYVEMLPPGTQLADANIKPRLRMITLYHLANTRNYLVAGTGNRSELMIGYFTKYGDGGVDLLPIGSLLKSDVRDLAAEIGVPQRIIDRAPSAGLWAGQTDEQEMGLTYEDLDVALAAIDGGDTTGIAPDILRRVEQMISASAHKRALAPIFRPE